MFQRKQHRRGNRHNFLCGVFVIRRSPQRGTSAWRCQRSRDGCQQARLRAAVRGAPLHARRGAAVAGAAARPGRHHPAAAAAAAVAARPAAAAGRPRRPRPGRLAPTHAAQACHARRAYSLLVLGDCRRIRRGDAS